MARVEYQFKVKSAVHQATLLSLGAEPLGQSQQQDIYLAGTGTRRIRIEAERHLYAEKHQDIGARARVKEVEERVISRREAERLIREGQIVATICKNRTFYRLQNTIIAQDEVEHLGTFIEIHSDSEDELFRILSLLGIEDTRGMRESYLDLILARKLPRWLRIVLQVHDRFGELAFGLTSGILTTMGVLVGVNSASGSKLPVIAAVTAIGVADSWSDAFGMYNAKVAERGTGHSVAMRYALSTFIGKTLVPLCFLLPIFLLVLPNAIRVDLVLAALFLLILSVEQAIVAEESPWLLSVRNLTLAIFIVAVSSGAGSLVRRFCQ